MAARVFTLKKPARCADCGKELEEGVEVRGYPLPNGGWKIYCLKHPQKTGNSPQSEQSTTNQQPTTNTQSAYKKEVLEWMKRVEEKLDRILSLLEGKDEETPSAM